MIFKILKIRNTMKELKQDPGKFAGGELGGFFMGMFLMPIISAVLLLGGLFIIGFTEVLGGPYGFFKILFFLVLFPVMLFFFMLSRVYKVIKASTKSAVDETIVVSSKVVE